MAKPYIQDLAEGARFQGIFLLTQRQLKPFANKPGFFMLGTLADKSGSIGAVLWEAGESVAEIPEESVVRVSGQVGIYKGERQIAIETISLCPESDYDPADLLPTTPRDTKQMAAEFEGVLAEIPTGPLRRLLDAFFGDDLLRRQFYRWPAAKLHHHPYLGGLLEHTLGVAAVCKTLAGVYPAVDRPLLLTGAILHDIGKLREFQVGASISISDEGRLLGHIPIGYLMVEERINLLGEFSPELRMKLLHMIVAHHGELENGSPQRPQTIEAMALYLADNLDAQLWKFGRAAREASGNGKLWTEWDKSLERYIFLGSRG